MTHALIVDDEVEIAEATAGLIAARGLTVAMAHSLRDARRELALRTPDLILLDLRLPDGSGLELFRDPELVANSQVVLVTGHASLQTSIEALRLGAADYLLKPFSVTQLQGILSRVMAPSLLRAEVDARTDAWQRTGRFGGLIGSAPAMHMIYRQIARVAGTSVTVLIAGESGTGKEVVAREVHELSRRRSRPFLAVNCGAISPNLIESEIFGHEKGSFTGAERQHHGFFERADGGTLFLDEITEMPLELQVKLLRVLETGSFTRVGSTQPQETDVRIIAATNRDPEQAVAAGTLRQDLYYRLNVFPILMPPLRERADDIPALATHFLDLISSRESAVKRFSPAALERLTAYHWPGNVRELRNAVARAYVMAAGDVVTEEWLPLSPAVGTTVPPSLQRTSGALVGIPIGCSLDRAERLVIEATMQHFKGNRERTAAALGVSVKTLYNRVRAYAAADFTNALVEQEVSSSEAQLAPLVGPSSSNKSAPSDGWPSSLLSDEEPIGRLPGSTPDRVLRKG